MRFFTLSIAFLALLFCCNSLLAQGGNDSRVRKKTDGGTEETEATAPAGLVLTPFNIQENKRPGGVKGKLTDASTGEDLIQAMVMVGGTTQGTLSDFEGNYMLDNLKPGTYALIFSYGGYISDTVFNIVVTEGNLTEVNVKLQDMNVTLDAVQVVAERVAVTNNVALISDIKTSSVIETGISSQQIQNSQARNAGDVVRNLPGIQVVDGSFVNIRGLSERYNVVMLNNVVAPSTESDKRAFSFNTVPSSMLDRIVVYRSPSPELYADMGGGIVRIYTRNVPDKNELSASLQLSYRPGSTFEEVRSFKMPGAYSLGFYNGSSDVPGNFPGSGEVRNTNYGREERTEFGRQLDNSWATRMQQTTPDVRASIGYGTRFNVGKEMVIGTSTTLRYSQTHTYFQQRRDDYIDGTIPSFYWNDDSYTRNISTGFLHNWVFIFNPNHKLEVKNFFNQSGNSQSFVRQGEELTGNDVEELRYSLYQENRTVYSGQLNGKHTFGKLKTELDWTGAYNYGSKNIPNWRQTLLSRQSGTNEAFRMAPGGFFPAALQKASQFWAFNEEVTYIASVNLKTDFKFFGRDAKLLYGGYLEQKQRTFDSRAFGLVYNTGPNGVYGDFSSLQVNSQDKYTTDVLEYAFSEDKFRSSGGLSIDEITQPQDSYDASQLLYSGYAATELPLGAKVKLFGGVRYENSEQKLTSAVGTGGVVSQEINVSNPFVIWMPTATLTYRITDKHVLRGSYSRTVNRPELRELAPFNFYNFDFNFNVRGNDSLRTATIDHYEFRYEFYPNPGDLITIGGFAKQFTDPIEAYQEVNAQLGSFSFVNADRAQSIGLEIELRKGFAFLSPKLKNLSIISNVAIIDSRVKFDNPDLANELGGADRPMQGQSRYVINAGLYYANKDKGLNASATYNVVGPSIVFVGNRFVPNTYLMPRHMLDLSFAKTITKQLEVSVGVANLLNAELRYVQDTNRDNVVERDGADNSVLRLFERPYYSLGIRFKM